MQKILAIDYGQAKVGLAVSSGFLAHPLKVIRYKTTEELVNEVRAVIEEEQIEMIIVGLSSGEIAAEARKLGDSLTKVTGLPVRFEDETLTTKDVQEKTIEAGMNRKKRKNMEDAFAAALILQSYLDYVQ